MSMLVAVVSTRRINSRRDCRAFQSTRESFRADADALHSIFQQRQKFRTGSGVLFESAEQTRSFHDRVLFFDASHHHAKMFCFYDDRHPRGLETSHQRLRDLSGKIFLDLQTTGKDIDNPRHLGQADHFPVRKISHMRTADERKQMMFAQRIELDVFDQNDLARPRLENRPVYYLVEILSITLREKLQG